MTNELLNKHYIKTIQDYMSNPLVSIEQLLTKGDGTLTFGNGI